MYRNIVATNCQQCKTASKILHSLKIGSRIHLSIIINHIIIAVVQTEINNLHPSHWRHFMDANAQFYHAMLWYQSE